MSLGHHAYIAWQNGLAVACRGEFGKVSEVAEAILNVERLAKKTKTLHQCGTALLLPTLSTSMPISAMANPIIEFLTPAGDDPSTVLNFEEPIQLTYPRK
jgi:hypothetical protein